jgi:hypothetical protein
MMNERFLCLIVVRVLHSQVLLMEDIAMKRTTMLCILVCSLLAAGQARAESWTERVTPKKPGPLVVKVHQLKEAKEGEVYQFNVTVKLRDNDFKLPKHSRLVEIFNGKEFVSSCEVQPTGPDGERTFSFRVAAKYLEKSKFTYTDFGEFDQIGWWFYLKDFVPSK